MRCHRIVAVTVVLCTALLVVPPAAFSLRCGSQIVERGDTKQRVYRACGEPDYQEVTGFQDIGRATVKIEIWFYDFGPQKFTQTLTFHGNRLVRIEAGDYGVKTFRK
ncbi:MAG: DUF2845 domain-containing protein [Desulfobacteraceae bacterium]|nr:DUF2845 domain-containing protein [Desulfobacteraceae bacterium]